MAKTYGKNRREPKEFDYRAELTRLKEEGPARVYLLRGEEDFLRDSFLKELRSMCVEEGTEAFNHHRLSGSPPDLEALRQALEAMPFMGERTLVEVRELDVNRTAGYDPEALKAIVTDVPEWATLAFVFAPGYAPDNRLGVVKALKKEAVDIEFSAPRASELVRWVQKQASLRGRRIDGPTASHLLFICGERMNTLLPEITKICGAAAGEEITRADIEAVAKKAPETTIFQLTDALGARKYDRAATLLADLLADPDEPPEKQIILVSEQFRRLYAARLAAEERLPESFITDCVPELAGRSYPLKLLREAARGYSRERLARAVRLCAECEFGMRSGGGPGPEELMKELVLRLAMDKT